MAVDLVFEFSPLVGSPVHLVFGESGDAPGTPDATIDGFVVLTRPTLSGAAVLGIVLSGAATLARPSLSGSLAYFTDTARPLTHRVADRFQDAGAFSASVTSAFDDSDPLPVGVDARWQDADRLAALRESRWADARRTSRKSGVRFQDGASTRRDVEGIRFEDGIRYRTHRAARFSDALRVGRWATAPRFQDGLKIARNSTEARFQDGVRYSVLMRAITGRGARRFGGLDDVRYQDAMRPPPGIYVPPPPEPDDCYIPDTDLLFRWSWVAGDTNILFVCDYYDPDPPPGPEPGTVVPVRKVYIVVNSAVLIRVSDGKPIPASSLTMGLDVDSWTWTFSAAVPAAALPDVTWQAGEPVEVQATVNGTAFRFIVESIARDRTFASDGLRISGRGRSALLDAPYSPVLNLFQEDPLTSQQLAEWVLTDNSVPIGWAVNWGITAWNVPGGVFSHSGSYIAALNRIAAAGGAYLQPHNTADQILVVPRYPVAPWDWGDVTPDLGLPAAVVQTEGTEWLNKPRYNRVYVSGEAVGVLGQVTRAGTAGDLLAPAVVDPLITHADAARQRGIAVLSDVGRIANVSLRLPVLAETGVIKPGTFVQYTEGSTTRIGITRSVQVQVALPSIYQTVVVETHDEPL